MRPPLLLVLLAALGREVFGLELAGRSHPLLARESLLDPPVPRQRTFHRN